MGMLAKLYNHLRLVIKLIKDPRVPGLLKVIPFLPLLYVIWPIDFIPDLIPGLGQLDDLGAIILGLEMFLKMVPTHIMAEYESGDTTNTANAGPGGNVVDGEYREVRK